MDTTTTFSTLLAAHSRNAKVAELPADRIVNLQARNAEGPAPAGPERGAAASQLTVDWSSAIELIREASEAIRISEDRAAELEEQLAQFTEDAAEQIRRLNAEIGVRDQRIAQSEERLRASETRAENAEAWLRKLHDAVHSSFAPLRRR